MLQSRLSMLKSVRPSHALWSGTAPPLYPAASAQQIFRVLAGKHAPVRLAHRKSGLRAEEKAFPRYVRHFASKTPPSDRFIETQSMSVGVGRSRQAREAATVLAIPVRRPLFPSPLGMQVSIKDQRLIAAVLKQVKAAYPGPFYVGVFYEPADLEEEQAMRTLSYGAKPAAASEDKSPVLDAADTKSAAVVTADGAVVDSAEITAQDGHVADSTTAPNETNGADTTADPMGAEQSSGSSAASGKPAEAITEINREASTLAVRQPDSPAKRTVISRSGTYALAQLIPTGEGSLDLLLFGQHRITATSLISDQPIFVNIDHHAPPKVTGPRDDADQAVESAYASEVLKVVKELAEQESHRRAQFQDLYMHLEQNPSLKDNLSRLVDMCCMFLDAKMAELQGALEEMDPLTRCKQVLTMMRKDLEKYKLQQELMRESYDNLSKMHRKVLLQEQRDLINKELGTDKDSAKATLKQKFIDNLKGKTVPADVQKVINEEMERFSGMDTRSMEFEWVRNYLNWVTQVPWGVYTADNLDLEHAQKVLDEDHYGLETVKKRILEFISVGILRGTLPKGKIICLVGPPGVGKTSVASSVARALSRKFYRMAVGGMHDIHQIKGFSRTYVGSQPGELTRALKLTGSQNPVLCIDEVDKVDQHGRGNVSATLLEVLDPEQNHAFWDYYMEVPLDLSKVLFICTANTTDTIPGPLRDRMEFIELSPYLFAEKKAIATTHLIPKASKEIGLTPEQFRITDSALDTLIAKYVREAGVRRLFQQIEKLLRNVVMQLVRKDQPLKSVEITEERVHEYLGVPPHFTSELYEGVTPPGVAMGLVAAGDRVSGAVQYVECGVSDKKAGGGYHLTGSAGDVLKESAMIAFSVAKMQYTRVLEEAKQQAALGYRLATALHRASSHLPAYAADALGTQASGPGSSTFFKEHHIHVHLPTGSTPKEGPSAGITLATAMLSLALNKPVKPYLTMTGELTLTGKVLPIGGVREKVVGARNSGCKQIIFPRANKMHFDELPAYVRENITPLYVDSFDDVYKIAFENWMPSAESSASSSSFGFSPKKDDPLDDHHKKFSFRHIRPPSEPHGPVFRQ